VPVKLRNESIPGVALGAGTVFVADGTGGTVEGELYLLQADGVLLQLSTEVQAEVLSLSESAQPDDDGRGKVFVGDGSGSTVSGTLYYLHPNGDLSSIDSTIVP
jgi:outer membrane protein assembly factor BamB